MPKIKPNLKQLKLVLTGHRRKPRLQKVLGRTPEFNSFFKLNGRVVGEQRVNQGVDFVELVSTKKRQRIAEGSLTLDREMDSIGRRSGLFSLLKDKRYAKISYRILPKWVVKGYLRKGIGTQVLKSLEQMAREQGIQILYGAVWGANKPSRITLKKQGYQRVKDSNFWFKRIN